MSRRSSLIPVLGILLAITVACTNKKSVNPLANVGSKQPDKVLFDRAMDAMKHNRFDVARMTLQVLINTYPDSEFIARAKLAELSYDPFLAQRKQHRECVFLFVHKKRVALTFPPLSWILLLFLLS